MPQLKQYDPNFNLAQLDPWGVGKMLLAEQPTDWTTQFANWDQKQAQAQKEQISADEASSAKQKKDEIDKILETYSKSQEAAGKPVTAEDMLAKMQDEYLRAGDADMATKLQDLRSTSVGKRAQSIDAVLEAARKASEINGQYGIDTYNKLGAPIGNITDPRALEGGVKVDLPGGGSEKVFGDGRRTVIKSGGGAPSGWKTLYSPDGDQTVVELSDVKDFINNRGYTTTKPPKDNADKPLTQRQIWEENTFRRLNGGTDLPPAPQKQSQSGASGLVADALNYFGSKSKPRTPVKVLVKR